MGGLSTYFGTDPEFCIVEKKSGKPVPAWRFFDTCENEKKKIAAAKAVVKYGTPEATLLSGITNVFRDGYAVEINTPPWTCRGLGNNTLHKSLKYIMNRIGEDHDLVTKAAVEIDVVNDMRDAPEDCLQFGCEPSLSAYTMDPEFVNLDAMLHPWRYFGGHMHISMGNYLHDKYPKWMRDSKGWNEEGIRKYMQLLDYYVGLPLAYIFDSPEQYERRKYYGRAGEFRKQQYRNTSYADGAYKAWYGKPGYEHIDVNGNDTRCAYGLEYRTTPSELWNHNALAGMAFGVMRYCWNMYDDLVKDLSNKRNQAVREAIDTGEGLDKKLLPTVPMFYTPDILDAARQEPDFRAFTIVRPIKKSDPEATGPGTHHNDPWVVAEGHYGWSEWVVKHKMELPKLPAGTPWAGGGTLKGELGNTARYGTTEGFY